AGRVERQHDELRAVARGARQTAMHVVDGGGANRAIDRQRQDRRCRGGGERRREGENTDEPRDGHGDLHEHRVRVQPPTRAGAIILPSTTTYAKRRRLNGSRSICDRPSTTHSASASPIAAECL